MDICERPRAHLRRAHHFYPLGFWTRPSNPYYALLLQVAYQRILQLTYVDDLLAALKTLFVKLFQPFLTNFVASLHSVNTRVTSAASTAVNTATSWDFVKAFEGWDTVFDKLLKGLEEKAAEVRAFSGSSGCSAP